MAKPVLRETDLYPPVRDLLVGQGFAVRGEVLGCDLLAVRGDEMVGVELKRGFNATLLMQACERQATCDTVYVAIPRPVQARGRTWRRLVLLLRRLELGLILVVLDSPVPRCEVALHPQPYQPRRATTRRLSLLRELAGRSGDHNSGGSSQRPLVTAYREQALRVAIALMAGPASPRELRSRGAPGKAGEILRANHYAWFERLGVGSYRLAPAGHQALATYRDVVAAWTGTSAGGPPPG